MGDNGGEASLTGQDGRGCEEESVGRPSLDSMPEAIHCCEAIRIGGAKVSPLDECGEEQALGHTAT